MTLASLSAAPIDSGSLPWAPIGPGFSFKPLHFLAGDRGYVLLLRVEPGTVVGRHRHTGEVHGFTLTGQRKILDTGEVVGPGGYVYEPPGNVDSWMAIGDEPLVVHVVVEGAIEYLGERDQVLRRADAATARESYRRHCEATGVDAAALFG